MGSMENIIDKKDTNTHTHNPATADTETLEQPMPQGIQIGKNSSGSSHVSFKHHGENELLQPTGVMAFMRTFAPARFVCPRAMNIQDAREARKERKAKKVTAIPGLNVKKITI